MEKLRAMMKRLAEQYALAPAARDEKAIGTLLTDMDAEARHVEAGYAGTRTLSDQVAALKTGFDEQTERLRKIEKLGLRERSNGSLEIMGYRDIMELRRVGRVFRSHDQAEAFGAMAARAIFGRMGVYGDMVAKRTRDLAESLVKDLDPGVATHGAELLTANIYMADLIAHVEAVGVLFPRADRVPLATTGTTTWPKLTGELTAHPTAARATIADTDPTYTTVTMSPIKWAALTYVPNEFFKNPTLLDALGQRLAWMITRAIGYAADNCLVNGDGTADYGGITGLLNAASGVTAVTAAAAATIAAYTAADVGNVAGGIGVDYVEDPFWMFSLSSFRKLRNIRDVTGGSIPLYSRGSNGDPNMIDDYPYQICQRFPAAGSVGASTLWGAFGDLRLSHYFGMLGSLEIAQSEHVKFAEDMTAIRGIAYFDAATKDVHAVVTMKTHS